MTDGFEGRIPPGTEERVPQAPTEQLITMNAITMAVLLLGSVSACTAQVAGNWTVAALVTLVQAQFPDVVEYCNVTAAVVGQSTTQPCEPPTMHAHPAQITSLPLTVMGII